MPAPRRCGSTSTSSTRSPTWPGPSTRGSPACGAGFAERLDSFAGTFSLQIGFVGIELSKGRNDRPDPVLTVRTLLDVLVRTAQKHPLVVVFDEFSGIAHVRGAAGMLRTQLQHHYRELGIVFAGSQPSTMQMLFTDRAQPFFAQADLVEIGPLEIAAVTNIVEDGFAATDRSTGGMVSHVVRTAEGHPQRAMQLADALWRFTPEGGTADEATWAAAIEDVRDRPWRAGSSGCTPCCPPGTRRRCRAVATGGRVYGRTAEVLELSPGTATAAVDHLRR